MTDAGTGRFDDSTSVLEGARVSDMNQFAAPEQWLAGLDARTAAALITSANDVALIIDGQGVIRDVSVGSDEFALDELRQWIGRTWLETVTVDSRPKVSALLRDATAKTPNDAPKWRHINHPAPGGIDVPVMYSAVPVGGQGRVVALGRDLRAVAALQQRLVEAQQSVERDYLRMRQTETRYRLLFESVAEAIVIVDVVSQTVVEANPAAARLIGDAAKRVVGRDFVDCIDPASRPAVTTLLAGLRAIGRADDIQVRLSGASAQTTLSTSMFRQDSGSLVLIRLLLAASAVAGRQVGDEAMLLRAVESVPDGFVVTDMQGRVLTANSTFAELVQLPAGERAQGQSLDRWLGRSGVDLNVLIGNLKQHGAVRLFPTTLHGQYGSPTPVEISAVAVADAATPCLGFTIRDVGRRLAPEARGAGRELPRSAGQLTELVGRMPLKDIVGETTDLIERLCIEAALELTRDNRASAAEMLGLSRQSLYVKLRRYGLGDLGSAS